MSASSRRFAPGRARMRARVANQWRCCSAPWTCGAVAGLASGEVRGMGGGTASCTSRFAEGSCAAAVCVCRAAPSLCAADGGADPYLFLHSAVVCVVE
jgi:hypothetical protein